MKYEATHDEVAKAFETWWAYHNRNNRDATHGVMTYGTGVRAFYKFTGVGSFINDRHVVTEAQLQRIRHMAGPHGYALLAYHLANE